MRECLKVSAVCTSGLFLLFTSQSPHVDLNPAYSQWAAQLPLLPGSLLGPKSTLLQLLWTPNHQLLRGAPQQIFVL